MVSLVMPTSDAVVELFACCAPQASVVSMAVTATAAFLRPLQLPCTLPSSQRTLLHPKGLTQLEQIPLPNSIADLAQLLSNRPLLENAVRGRNHHLFVA